LLIDASELPDGTTLHAEVCVVGAGPAGLTVARGLAAAGRDVVVLESGPRAPDAASRDLAAGERVGHPYFALEETRLRAFGGTSHSWPLVEGWRLRRLDPLDLEGGRGRGEGWPLSYGELARHYPLAEERCGITPGPYEAEAWAGPETPVLPLPPAVARTTTFRYSLEDFTDPAHALGGAAVRVVLRATVTALERKPDGPVEAVAVRGPDGRSLRVACRTAVLAAGGIENATLLLASDGADPGGMGNRHDLVGRYFMERLTLRTGAVRPAEPAVTGRLDLYRIHRRPEGIVQGVLTPAEQEIRRHGLRNSAFFVEARDRASTSEGIRSLVTLLHLRDRRPVPPHLARHALTVARHGRAVGTTAWRRVARRPAGDEVVVLRAQAEPTPLHRSRVVLGEGRDALGRRRARLDWQVDPDDLASIMRSQALLGEAFAAAGLGELEVPPASAPPPLVEGAHHHVGTTRMHPDPRRGVVDADGRVHGVPNLYVAGSSVFPTAGYANPTLTVVALALRLAAHLTGRSPG
jgi:choline dehydrogenase-like flavoprotein